MSKQALKNALLKSKERRLEDPVTMKAQKSKNQDKQDVRLQTAVRKGLTNTAIPTTTEKPPSQQPRNRHQTGVRKASKNYLIPTITGKLPSQQLKAAQSRTGGLAKKSEQMSKKLAGSKFRWINERLYTVTSEEAAEMFRNDPELFEVYHAGFRTQTESWPVNPLDVIIGQLQSKLRSQKMEGKLTVADMGCGEAMLARTLIEGEDKNSSLKERVQVHSFDLHAANEYIQACDIAHVPLKDGSVDVVVFCLSLMGVNTSEFLREAARILKSGGELKIAEVSSRFTGVETFVDAVCGCGFQLIKKYTLKDHSAKQQVQQTPDERMVFTMFDFKRSAGGNDTGAFVKKRKRSGSDADGQGNIKQQRISGTIADGILLKPCLYKKR